MSKANKPGSQKPTTNNAAGAQKTTAQSMQTGESTSSSQPTIHRAKQGGKNRKSTIGGTAVQGSKSTQPKEIPTTPAAQQQPESYNREMRRRMEHTAASAADIDIGAQDQEPFRHNLSQSRTAAGDQNALAA